MSYTANFKREFSFQERVEESSRVLSKYPDRRPVICEKLNNQKDLPDIDKKKYLVPYDLTMGQFMYVIRKRINLRPEEGLFLFINNQIITYTSIIGHIYEYSKDPDGFLYVYYAKENIFG
jgi:GABA(A) receptor-associated protein